MVTLMSTLESVLNLKVGGKETCIDICISICF